MASLVRTSRVIRALLCSASLLAGVSSAGAQTPAPADAKPKVDIYGFAQADAIVVTGDSVNMVGEACATGAPVHVYEPSGGSPKITRFIDRLIDAGAVRRWSGKLEEWSYQPVDATREIAEEAARRYLSHRLRFRG